MSLVIAGKTIERVKIVDDDANGRKGVALIVGDADLEPLPEDGPLPKLNEFLSTAIAEADAVVCDHRLKQGTYAHFDGAEAVARFYELGFPAVLFTAWSKADIDAIRLYRRYIPALIPSDKVDPDSITKGFQVCVEEFNGRFLPSREPVRTIVRIESVDREQKPPIVYAVVSSWNPREVVRFPLDVVAQNLRGYVEPDKRLFAKVNIGAEDQADLYFEDFEYRG